MSDVFLNGNHGYNAKVDINGSLRIGTGSLDVGQTLNVSEAAYIGYGTPSDGKVTVSSATAIWNIGTAIFIGYDGPGALTVGNGGTVSVASLDPNSYGPLRSANRARSMSGLRSTHRLSHRGR